MKKYLLLLCTGLLIGHLSSGQTRKIMHRSHSGKDHTLTKDESEDDFGLTPEMRRVQDTFIQEKGIA